MPVAELTASARGSGAELRAALAATLEAGKGVAHVLDRARRARRSSPAAAPARAAGAALPSPIRACCRSTRRRAGASSATAPALRRANSRPSRPARNRSGSSAPMRRPRAPVRPATARASTRSRCICASRPLDQRADGPDRRCAARSSARACALDARGAAIARDALAEIRSRLQFLARVGLGYLTLDRAAPTLSGGEAQRIRLAAQLGSNLQGVCYVLDEPTIGLHPRDNAVLLDALDDAGRSRQHADRRRARRGHDPARRSHHRPGPGRRRARRPAGRRRAPPSSCARNPLSVTGRLLAAPLRHAAQAAPTRSPNRSAALQLEGVTLHNLRIARRAHTAGPAGGRSPAYPAPASRRWRATCCTPICDRR